MYPLKHRLIPVQRRPGTVHRHNLADYPGPASSGRGLKVQVCSFDLVHLHTIEVAGIARRVGRPHKAGRPPSIHCAAWTVESLLRLYKTRCPRRMELRSPTTAACSELHGRPWLIALSANWPLSATGARLKGDVNAKVAVAEPFSKTSCH